MSTTFKSIMRKSKKKTTEDEKDILFAVVELFNCMVEDLKLGDSKPEKWHISKRARNLKKKAKKWSIDEEELFHYFTQAFEAIFAYDDKKMFFKLLKKTEAFDKERQVIKDIFGGTYTIGKGA